MNETQLGDEAVTCASIRQLEDRLARAIGPHAFFCVQWNPKPERLPLRADGRASRTYAVVGAPQGACRPSLRIPVHPGKANPGRSLAWATRRAMDGPIADVMYDYLPTTLSWRVQYGVFIEGGLRWVEPASRPRIRIGYTVLLDMEGNMKESTRMHVSRPLIDRLLDRVEADVGFNRATWTSERARLARGFAEELEVLAEDGQFLSVGFLETLMARDQESRELLNDLRVRVEALERGEDPGETRITRPLSTRARNRGNRS